MALRNSATGWGWLARLLHWGMALLIIGLLLVGWYMVNVVGNGDLVLRYQLTQTHKSFGFVVFVLALLRLLWRSANPTPLAPAAPKWETVAAGATHAMLYALMIVLPLSGWLMASASPMNDAGAFPFQVRNMVFGLFALPDPVHPGSRSLEAAFKTVHLGAAIGLAALLALHAGAAAFHHLVRRDDVLRRMTVGSRAAATGQDDG
jgi:cytochrome b561